MDQGFCIGISYEVNICRGLDKVDMDYSISCNALAIECRAHEYINMLTTNEIKVTATLVFIYCVLVKHIW